MATKAWYFLSALVATLLGFTVTAHAANAIDPSDGSLDLARTLYAALTGGHYAYAGALALVGGVALLRKFGGKRWPSLHTDAGAALLALGGAFGTTLAAAFAGGGALSLPVLAAAGATAFAAMGGYAAVRAVFVVPYLVPWAAKAPAWLRPPLQVLIFWFVHKSDPDAPGNSDATRAVTLPCNNICPTEHVSGSPASPVAPEAAATNPKDPK